LNSRSLRLALGCVFCLGCTTAFAQGDAKKGEYIAKAAACLGCHTESTPGSVAFAGGRRLDTPFGAFHGPNITAHPAARLGKWSEADFRRALRLGERPDGSRYYAAFPYTSFTGMSEGDIRDLWAYLRSIPQSDRASRAHELRFPYRWRILIGSWKRLFFMPGPAVLNRGAYLAGPLGHCAKCHTPRTAQDLTAPDRLPALFAAIA
jgi:hypothetical protein